jgi:hypothetical protein
MARCDAPDVLLLQRPSRFDRIVVGRVRRQVDDANAARGAGGRNARIVMGAKVVHDDDVAAAELGQQLGLHPRDEAVLVRGREHAREHDPAGQADRAEQREVLAPVHGNSVDEFLAALHPSVAPAHRHVHPRLVEEHQAVSRHAPDAVQERSTLDDDVRPQTLQWPSALFFTTYPCRRSARLMLETCTRSRRGRCRLNSAVSSPAVASRTFASATSRSISVTTEGVPPPLGVGSTPPSRRCRCTHRFTDASPTANRAATSG